MGIRRLPENLINQIAAGEVVERPASALKELVENAIDAKASQIDIIIDDGGKSLISVSDNGIGINKKELPLAVERHATSKLPNDNLVILEHLGFRGEALPSIAAVSELNIQTRANKSKDAWSLDVIAGKFKDIYPSSRQLGTIITVRKLFFATPARLKFLKSSQVENSYCHQMILKQALANPSVGFRFQANGRELLNIRTELDEENQYLNRIGNIMGLNFVDEETLGISLSERTGLQILFGDTPKAGFAIDGKKESLRIRNNKKSGKKLDEDASPAFDINSGKTLLIK